MALCNGIEEEVCARQTNRPRFSSAISAKAEFTVNNDSNWLGRMKLSVKCTMLSNSQIHVCVFKL